MIGASSPLAQLHPALVGLEEQIDALREVGANFWQRGWSLGTSSNYSVVVSREPLELLVTASGMDKGRLARGDFVRIGASGKPVAGRGTDLKSVLPVADGQPKSSAETLLHVVAAGQPGVGAVLHTHSVWSTLLSDLFFPQGGIEISGYEMLKGLAGIATHEHASWIEIFENTQNIPALAEQVRERLGDPADPMQHGYLIRKHGLYTWGRDLDEARRHVEILEFLLECTARRLVLTGELKANGVL